MSSTADLLRLMQSLSEHDLTSSLDLSHSNSTEIVFSLDLSSTALSRYTPTVRLTPDGRWTVSDLPEDDVDDLLKAYELAERHCKRQVKGGIYEFDLSDLVDLINDV